MIFAVDFGGTRIKLGLVEHGVIHAYHVIAAYADEPFMKWLPRLKDELQTVCRSTGLVRKDIEGMVWAFPLIIEPGLRHAAHAFGKYEDIIHHDFCDLAEQQFHIPLLLENDARAALIGEWENGAARDRDNAVMITLGTGLGTAVIFEGKPMRGRSGLAGNLGGRSITHLQADDCGDAAAGCIESQVATWALRHKMTRMKGYRDSLLADEPHVDYRAVFRRADQGDALACRLRDRALEAWGALALNMIQAYDPECVVFGGGIMASEDKILPSIRAFIDRYAFQAGDAVDIVKARLGDQAALVGAEWIWKTSEEKSALKLR